MDEARLRQLVREVVARHLEEGPPPLNRAMTPTAMTPSAVLPSGVSRHPSHGRFHLVPSPDGACIVEPAVPCTHCGYCQSMGH